MKIPEDIREGANIAPPVCMNIQPENRVYIISDEGVWRIGKALEELGSGSFAAGRSK